MARLPPIPPQAQTPAQKQRHEVMDQLRESLGNSFVAKDKSGALVGPFASFLSVSLTRCVVVKVPSTFSC
jgi:hypothetical protein